MVKSPNLEVYSGRPHRIHDRDQQTVPLPIKPNAKPSPVSSVVPFRALEWWEYNVSTFVLSIAVKRAALNLNVSSNIGVPLPSWCQPANFIFENRPNVRSSTRPLCSIQTVGSNSHHIEWSDWNNADEVITHWILIICTASIQQWILSWSMRYLGMFLITGGGIPTIVWIQQSEPNRGDFLGIDRTRYTK